MTICNKLDDRIAIFTPKGLHLKAQGRGAHPGLEAKKAGQPCKGCIASTRYVLCNPYRFDRLCQPSDPGCASRPWALRYNPFGVTRRAFSLVELLVVVAIIGILVAILIPAIQQARTAALRQSDNNNLHQLGVAIATYESNLAHYPSEADNGANDFTITVMNSVFTQLLPYIGNENYFQALKSVDPIAPVGYGSNSLLNAQSIGNIVNVKIYLCPGRRNYAPGKVDYAFPGSCVARMSSLLYLANTNFTQAECCASTAIVNPLSGYAMGACDESCVFVSLKSVLGASNSSPSTAGMVASLRGTSYSMLLSEKAMLPSNYHTEDLGPYDYDAGFCIAYAIGDGSATYWYDHMRGGIDNDSASLVPDSQLSSSDFLGYGSPFNALPLLLADGSVRHTLATAQNGGLAYNKSTIQSYYYFNNVGATATCGQSIGAQAVDSCQ